MQRRLQQQNKSNGRRESNVGLKGVSLSPTPKGKVKTINLQINEAKETYSTI